MEDQENIIFAEFRDPLVWNSVIKFLIISSTKGLHLINVSIGGPNLLSIFAPNDIHSPFLILRFDNSTLN